MSVVLVRVALVAAAVAGVIPLAGELSTARDVENAVDLVTEERSPARVDEALALLHGAAAETADTTPLVRAAELQAFAGRYRAALTDAREAARREPENARAWLVGAQAAARLGDEAAAATARRRLAELVARP